MGVLSDRSAQRRTQKFFDKQHLLLQRQLDGINSGTATTAHLHGEGSKDRYADYGPREMLAYESETTTVLADGVLAEWSLRDVRAAYLKPVIDAIEAVPNRPARVLEIGCGNATNLMILAAQFGERAAFSGIDISGDRINAGKSHWGERLSGVELIETSATELGCFQDRAFDVVFSVCALEQIPILLHAAVREMTRVADGTIVCVEPVPEFGNDTQRIYNLVAGQCRTLLPELEATGWHLDRAGLLPVLHNPLNPVGVLRATRPA